jgi:mono/diheme cytochrome c family protein
MKWLISRVIPCMFIAVMLSECAYNDLTDRINCEDSGLAVALVSKADASSCRSIDGSLIVEGSGGKPGYDFSLNGGPYQTNPSFTNLAPGDYVVWVKDLNGCLSTVAININSPDSNLAASITKQNDSECFTDNGVITVTGSGGTSPYVYQLNASGFSATNTFSNLKAGNYSVVVKDAEDCQKVVSVTVPRGQTGTSYQTEIKPIFETNCTLSGCHDSNAGDRDWTDIGKIQMNASKIKTRTSNKTMPIGGLTLTQQQIDLIACWVDDGAPNN